MLEFPICKPQQYTYDTVLITNSGPLFFEPVVHRFRCLCADVCLVTLLGDESNLLETVKCVKMTVFSMCKL